MKGAPQDTSDVTQMATRRRYKPGDFEFAVKRASAGLGLFAVSRSVGLLAHSMEQLAEPQVIRPRGRYVGPVPLPSR